MKRVTARKRRIMDISVFGDNRFIQGERMELWVASRIVDQTLRHVNHRLN
jgi:hypothetical protein